MEEMLKRQVWVTLSVNPGTIQEIELSKCSLHFIGGLMEEDLGRE